MPNKHENFSTSIVVKELKNKMTPLPDYQFDRD